jgi:hypothetical protein
MTSVSEQISTGNDSGRTSKALLPITIHLCHIAQDGHSRSEQLLYDILWKAGTSATPDSPFRLAGVSMRELSRHPSILMTEKNVRLALRRLADKLAIEEDKTFDHVRKTARVWKVYSYKSILERRRSAGMEWVVRSSQSVRFVDPNTPTASQPQIREVTEVVTTPVVSQTTPVVTTPVEVAATPVVTTPTTPVVTTPHLETVVEPQGAPSTSTFPLATSALLDATGRSDDDAVNRLVESCRKITPDATEEEIVHFLQIEAARVRNNSRIFNPTGFLLTSVPKCFAGESFRRYRDEVRRQRDAADRQRQLQEQDWLRLRNEQLQILENPNSSECDRNIARKVLGLDEPGCERLVN